MLIPLRNPTFRRLFAAQAVALLGTGLLTVALALLAYELAGDNAGAVLGTALAIKMVAYVSIAPIAGALAGFLPRKIVLIALDLIRAAIALCLPFVDQVWQIYMLIFVLQSASGAFTPTFQAVIPDILPDEKDYTKALALSRLAYDFEALLSPIIAAALLTVLSFHSLFAGTSLGFLLSAAFVFSAILPGLKAHEETGFADRLTKGIRIYLLTPRLRGLLSLNLALAAAGAIVIVNTVVIVRDILGLSDRDVAIAFAVYGFGSMMAALVMPRLLEIYSDRSLMLSAAGFMAIPLLAGAFALLQMQGGVLWTAILMFWPMLGAAYAAIAIPSGRLLRRSCREEDRPALFAAQFALSHACWLVTYPLAGWLGSSIGMAGALAVHAILTLFAFGLAFRLWPSHDPEIITHTHSDLPQTHPHLRAQRGRRHAHLFVIDNLHRRWPV